MRFWPRGLGIGGRYGRAFVAALLVVNQFAVASGLPFPMADTAIKKDLSKPFPCMNRPCGCQNADQCWHECCCFTMREKLAWAKANGVTPPDFVREAAAREALADAANAGHEHGALCQKRHCCCCCCCKSPAPAKTPVEPARKPDGKSVVLIMALECHGQGLLSILAQALPATVPVIRRYERAAVGMVAIAARSFCSILFSPPVPPPRKCARNFFGVVG